MAEKIWRYRIPVREEVSVEMPRGAKVLSIQRDKNRKEIAMWARVDPANKLEARNFSVRGTDHPLPPFDLADYVATVMEVDSPFVWHIFEYPPGLGPEGVPA